MSSRQDKATTERHAKALRLLVKQDDNKNCADCKKNDARWASWNLGVFVCIRCSGIHRSMGTHISKVKSIDLDVWQPEQMDSITRWGNRRANTFWEYHLKKGHVPPDHKMESFIRSKYESRRWALSDQPPSDPSVLDRVANGEQPPPQVQQQQQTAPPPVPERPSAQAAPAPRRAHPLLSTSNVSSSLVSPTHRARPVANLLDEDAGAGDGFGAFETSAKGPAKTQQQQPAGQEAPKPKPTAAARQAANNLFDLDFKAPPAPSRSSAQTRSKQDILALFSTASPAAPTTLGAPITTTASSVAPSLDMWSTPAYATAPAPAPAPAPASSAFSSSPPQYRRNPSTSVSGVTDSFSGMGFGSTPSATTRSAPPPMASNVWASASSTSPPAASPSALTNGGGSGSATAGTNGYLSSGADVWGSSTASSAAAPAPAAMSPPAVCNRAVMDDPFKNIWG